MIALFASQVGPIWLEVPALLVVPEGRYHDLVQDLPVDGPVLDGNQELECLGLVLLGDLLLGHLARQVLLDTFQAYLDALLGASREPATPET